MLKKKKDLYKYTKRKPSSPCFTMKYSRTLAAVLVLTILSLIYYILQVEFDTKISKVTLILSSISNRSEIQYRQANKKAEVEMKQKLSKTRLVMSGDVITWTQSNGWTKLSNMCSVREGFVLSHLTGSVHTPIYVYHREDDMYVSGSIMNAGMWEYNMVNKLQRFLSRDPGLVFLDIGSNVGVYTLMAAQLGRKVFAVDCLSGNVQRLCASVKAGHFSDRVTVIYNALSNKRENVTFGTYKGNVGGTYVKKLDPQSKSDSFIMSILLDDLLEIYNFHRVMIKMDVETYEHNVLKGAEKFFSEVQVDYLLMEFKAHRGKESGKFIIEFLDRHNLKPQVSPEIVSSGGTEKWPADVLWIRKDKRTKK